MDIRTSLLIIILPIIYSQVQFTNQQTKIKVVEPIPLQNKLVDALKDITIANFGTIPYDRSIQGHAVKASPFDACTSISNNTQKAPIIFVERGGCTFTQKAMNAQLIGAKLVIAIDNVVETDSDLQLIPDYHAGEVDIPMIMINRNDGIIFNSYLQSDEPKDSVVISVVFPKLQHLNIVSVDIWLSSSNYASLLMTQDLHDTIDKDFRDDENLIYSIGYAYHYCVQCAKTGFQQQTQNCLCGGRYCSTPIQESMISGDKIVTENIKQKCIYNQLMDHYSAYLQMFRQLCFDQTTYVLNPDPEQCGRNILHKMGINDQVEQCYQTSFESSDHHGAGDNEIAKVDRDELTQLNIHQYPTVLINDVQYKGKLHGASIIQAICNSFLPDKMPAHCQKMIYSKDNYDRVVQIIAENQSYTQSVMVYLVSTIIALGIVLVLYRRHLKREMKKEMQVQVNSAISQYYALTDSKVNQQVD